MDRIFDTRTIKGIKLALSSMSGELDELYREALVRIQKQAGNDGELGMRILSWITHAKRPLSVDELQYGLAVEYSDVPKHLDEFDEDNLLPPGSLVDVCAGLVIIDSNSRILRLVHYTTQEYLDNQRMQLFKDVEVDISRACLTSLSYNVDTDFHDEETRYKLIQSHPFLEYACQHWFSHAKNVLLSEDADSRLVKAMAYFKSSDSIGFSIDLLQTLPDRRFTGWPGFLDRQGDAYPYEVASQFGLEDLVRVLFDRRIGPCPSLDSSLVYAAFGGHLNVAKLLLQNGAAIDGTTSYEHKYRTSVLESACTGGHLAVVDFLIENGADIHGRDTSLLPPIHAAAMSDNPDIIDLLLKKGVNVNARNAIEGTACHVAANFGWIESTRHLIDAGCDLELRNNNGDTVLLACGEYPKPKMISLLLDRGADACAKNKKGKTLRNIVEGGLRGPYDYREYERKDMERIVERLRRAEQQSSTTATNDSQQSEPPFSEQTISSTSTLQES